MKKLIAFLLSLTFVLCSFPILAGCGGGGDAKEIRVFLMTNSEQDAYFAKYFKQMEERFGCTIKFTGATFSDYYNQLRTELKDNPPDIFYIRPGDIKKFAQDNLLADFNSYIKGSDFASKVDLSKIYKHAVDMYRYDGTNVGVSNDSAALYGINLGFSYQGLGYNKNILLAHETEIRAAGIKMPWEFGENESYTFEEFSTVATICTTETGGGSNGDKPVYGLNMSTEIILPYIWSRGGDVIVNGQPTVDTEEVKWVLNWLNDGVNGTNGKQFIFKEATWAEWVGEQVAFFTEVGSWEVGGYRAYEGFSYDMMPWPTINGDGNWYGQIGTSALAVYNHSKNKELAMQIAGTFFEARTLDEMVRAGLSLPMDIETAENAYLAKENDDIYFPEHRSYFIDVISSKNGKFSPINNTYSSEWLDIFVNDLDTIWNGTKTVQAYVTSKQVDMRAIYSTGR